MIVPVKLASILTADSAVMKGRHSEYRIAGHFCCNEVLFQQQNYCFRINICCIHFCTMVDDHAHFINSPSDFEDFNRTVPLASLMEVGLTESDKGPSGYWGEASH